MRLRVSSLRVERPDGLVALDAVSLDVDAGEIVAIVGPNGAGKTTLLDALAGRLAHGVMSGTIELEGRAVERRSAAARARRGVHHVGEDRGLFQELTVDENLLLGAWGLALDETRDRLERVRALHPVLEERAGERAAALSGGERTILALARAQVRRPSLLLVDEPFASLAPATARHVRDSLAGFARRGTAVLLAEPEPHRAFGLARRAVALDAGRVVQVSSLEELIAREEG
jgi:branched-chain amino acid transport system ATP-binding protein